MPSQLAKRELQLRNNATKTVNAVRTVIALC
jgi:hypothetical protein